MTVTTSSSAPSATTEGSTAAPITPIVALHDVTKVYPTGRAALSEVNLFIPEGDFVFLVGPSGAGKSTLIKLLIRD